MAGTLKWINLLAFLAMIAVNALANLLPLGGHTTGEVSAEYPNLFTPQPFTFAIWIVIYLFMCIYIIMQLGSTDTNMTVHHVNSAIGCFFILSCVFNIAWIFSWHFSRIGLSVIFMVLLLVTLIIINTRLTDETYTSFWGRMTVYGFNIYLGWIAVATIANISVFLVKSEWSGFGMSNVIWTLFAIALGTLVGIGFVMVGHRYFASLAVIWAFWGIFMKHISSSNTMRRPAVAIGAIIAITVILIFMIISTLTSNDPKEV